MRRLVMIGFCAIMLTGCATTPVECGPNGLESVNPRSVFRHVEVKVDGDCENVDIVHHPMSPTLGEAMGVIGGFFLGLATRIKGWF